MEDRKTTAPSSILYSLSSFDSSNQLAPELLLFLPRELDRVARPRLRLQSDLADRLARPLADAVAAVHDLGQRGVDFAQDVALLLHQPERELLLVVVGAHVGHVQ